MARTTPFDEHPDRYDAWFDRHEAAYRSELGTVRALWPAEAADALEIGVGTGRFAAALGIQHGIDPSPAMRKRARTRGIAVRDGVGEAVPYPDACFDAVLLTTTLCYLDDPLRAFREAYRVLRPGGAFVVAFIDRDARQTLFGDPEAMDTPDPVQPGTGEGGFVVLRGLRPA
jgi:SAM-dependent methyltransferase